MKTTGRLVSIGCCIVYSLLAWQHIVPSIFHMSPIRKIWDKHFAECSNHKKHQEILQEGRGKLFLTFSLHGRLGNWMFAYASLLGIGKLNNRVAYIPDNHGLVKIFKIKNMSNEIPMCMEMFREKLPCAYDPRMEDLPAANLTLLEYLQSWRYFANVKNHVQDQFQFQSWIYEAAKSIFLHYRNKESKDLYKAISPANSNLLTVCVHVRRTDMMIPSSTKLGFKAAPSLYIHNAMNHMRTRFSGSALKFLVITDDYEWCSENLMANDTVIIPPNDKGVDLAILTMCNHSIITTGTFGWWGAYLAGGYTVYYKNFPEPGSKLDRNTVHGDYYPEEWVGLDTGTRTRITFSLTLLLTILIQKMYIYLFIKGI